LDFEKCPVRAPASSDFAQRKFPLFYPVDKKTTYFALSTQDIDRFFTKEKLVDNFHAHNVTVVDKLRKTIARLVII
jgi:hypothetical protein